jgi:hypothetical protein
VQLTTVEGTLEIKDQLKEYVDRGPALAEMGLLQFSLDTYETDQTVFSDSGRGRKPKPRFPYLEGTGHGTKCRVIKGVGHETMPNFVGDWFPRNDVPDLGDFYHASILALLSPWRDIGDLKRANQTFTQAFEQFLAQADAYTRDIVDNIQYHHECSDGAHRKRQSQTAEDKGLVVYHDEDDEPFKGDGKNANNETLDGVQYTERDVDNNIAAQFSAHDKLFAEVALNIAVDQGIFKDDPCFPHWKRIVLPATHEQLLDFQVLERLVKAVTKHRLGPDNRDDLSLPADLQAEHSSTLSPELSPRESPPPDMGNGLNSDQCTAHKIITNHLKAHLEGRNPPQLLMMVIGQAGTGKSTLLNAITSTFEQLNAPQLLARTALSGVAASLIGGTTLHWFGGLAPRKIPQSDVWPDKSAKYVQERRKKNLLPLLWLAIDEVGMCTLDLLTLLSQVCGMIRAGDGKASSMEPFGGLNLILTGDFHQFAPVAGDNVALYCPAIARQTAVIGKAIYLQFETVVKLEKQERIDDKPWLEILGRTREGACTESDIREIRKLILTNPQCDVPDFKSEPWNKAVLVTPRNCVRAAWNRASVRRHCTATGELLYIFDAEDTVGNERVPTNMEQKTILASMKTDDTAKLPYRVEVAIGMEAMVTLNIATEADLANGSRGKIKDIVLDPREALCNTDVGKDGVVWLQYPPAMVLFEPYHHEFQPFPGLEPGLIPIFPSELSFGISYRGNSSTKVIRQQYPLSAAYAFTDHKAQGQTIQYVIVDIGKTVIFPVTPFAAYVALSRSRGRGTIRLLRDFDDTIFTRHPSEALRREDERLDWLAQETKNKFETGFYDYK